MESRLLRVNYLKVNKNASLWNTNCRKTTKKQHIITQEQLLKHQNKSIISIENVKPLPKKTNYNLLLTMIEFIIIYKSL